MTPETKEQIARLNKSAPILVQPKMDMPRPSNYFHNPYATTIDCEPPINVTDLINELAAENERLREALRGMVNHEIAATQREGLEDYYELQVAKQALESI